MAYRITLPIVLFAGALTGTLACSGSVLGGGGSAVTSLPSSDSVTSDAPQFCSDAVNYLLGIVPSIGPLDCAEAVEEEASQAAGGMPATPSGPSCQTEYNACIAAVGNATTSDPGAVQSGTTEAIAECTTAVQGCKGVTVGQVSTCLEDYGNALVALAKTVTSASACSGKTASIQYPATPASCSALPSDCQIAGASVSSGGSAPPSTGGGVP